MLTGTQQAEQQLAGRELAAVTFVRDYVQLSFDGPTLSAHTPITVTTIGSSVTSESDQFRNRICEQIGKPVTHVEFRPDEALILHLVGDTSLSFSLRSEHYVGPEALVIDDEAGTIIVF